MLRSLGAVRRSQHLSGAAVPVSAPGPTAHSTAERRPNAHLLAGAVDRFTLSRSGRPNVKLLAARCTHFTFGRSGGPALEDESRSNGGRPGPPGMPAESAPAARPAESAPAARPTESAPAARPTESAPAARPTEGRPPPAPR